MISYKLVSLSSQIKTLRSQLKQASREERGELKTEISGLEAQRQVLDLSRLEFERQLNMNINQVNQHFSALFKNKTHCLCKITGHFTQEGINALNNIENQPTLFYLVLSFLFPSISDHLLTHIKEETLQRHQAFTKSLNTIQTKLTLIEQKVAIMGGFQAPVIDALIMTTFCINDPYKSEKQFLNAINRIIEAIQNIGKDRYRYLCDPTQIGVELILRYKQLFYPNFQEQRPREKNIQGLIRKITALQNVLQEPTPSRSIPNGLTTDAISFLIECTPDNNIHSAPTWMRTFINRLNPDYTPREKRKPPPPKISSTTKKNERPQRNWLTYLIIGLGIIAISARFFALILLAYRQGHPVAVLPNLNADKNPLGPINWDPEPPTLLLNTHESRLIAELKNRLQQSFQPIPHLMSLFDDPEKEITYSGNMLLIQFPNAGISIVYEPDKPVEITVADALTREIEIFSYLSSGIVIRDSLTSGERQRVYLAKPYDTYFDLPEGARIQDLIDTEVPGTLVMNANAQRVKGHLILRQNHQCEFHDRTGKRIL